MALAQGKAVRREQVDPMTVGADARGRRRAIPVSVTMSRSALAVVRILHPEISRLQTRAAFLLSVSGRKPNEGDNASLEAEVIALQSAVEAYSETLSEQLRGLPNDVRNHGRILDTVRALKSAYGVLEAARANFGISSPTRAAPFGEAKGFGLLGGSH
jgi:hypothetical protein